MPTLLPTKFYLPPTPAGFVARPQLLEKMDQALTHCLTLVSAQAGAGKTTLVSAWAQAIRKKGPSVGWLSLDEADNAPDRFLEYLAACLDEGGAAIDWNIQQTEAVPLSPPDHLLAGLIQAAVKLKQDTVIILDDYHLIQNPEIHAALGYLLDHLPARLHLVLSTRSDPPLKLAQLRANGRLAEVRMQELRFLTPEAAAFFKKTVPVRLTDADVQVLNSRTEGWIAGLQMAAIALRGREEYSAFIAAFAGSHRFVFDYLLEEILNRQLPEVRLFLLKTCVLQRLSAGLCDAVAETGGSARAMLDRLERDNLFLVALDDERGWYRYHHLFSDLLRLILEQTHPGLSAELHRRACSWYEAQGMILDALQHALEAGDVHLAARLFAANMFVLFEHTAVEVTLQKLEALSLNTLQEAPWLGIARAYLTPAGQLQKSEQILDAVEQNLAGITDPGEHRRLQGHLAAARVYIYNNQEDIAKTVRYAQLADDLLPADERAIRAVILALWGDCLSRNQHDPSAMPILERALALAQQAEKPHAALIAAAALALGHLNAGRFHQAQRVCRQALVLAEDYQNRTQQELSAAAMNYALMARICLEWNDLEQALHFGYQGVALGERWRQFDAELLCLQYLGQALMFSGHYSQADQILQRSLRVARGISPWVWRFSAAFALDCLLDCETPNQADLQAYLRLVRESGAEIPPALKARLLLKEDQPFEALAVLEAALAGVGEQQTRLLIRLHVLRAAALLACGDQPAALDVLESALEQAEPEERVMTFVSEGKLVEKLLREALKKTQYVAFARRLLTAFEDRHRSQLNPTPDGLIDPLSERELEVLKYLDSFLSAPEIAERMVVSTNTVRTHIKNIYIKLGVHGRTEAVQQGRELGLIQLP